MLSKGGAERTEKLNTIDFSTQSFLEMTSIGLNPISVESHRSLPFIF